MNLPKPVDDGACNDLEGISFPTLELGLTNNSTLKLPPKVVIFAYPRISHPNKPQPSNWATIPGAKGCTPQARSYRDNYKTLKEQGFDVFGLSVQSTEDQAEAKERLELPYELISDQGLKLVEALKLPLLEVEEDRLIKRLTLVIIDGIIKKVFYPVFPSEENVHEVIKWIEENN